MVVAGSRAFGRGEAYARDSRVTELREAGGVLKATVDGAQPYSVRVRVSDDPNAIEGSCTCPAADEGAFCKHCVATVLAWLEGQERSRLADELERLALWLERLDPHVLRAVILEEADRDQGLRSSLLLRGGRGDRDQIRAAIDRALSDRGAFVPYAEAASYAQGIDDAIDLLEELAENDPPAAVEMAEHALRGVERAMERVDDSDGCMGSLLERLQDFHLHACHAARPDPEQLAERLFRWEQDGDWEVFLGAAKRYADVLGRAGLGRYRELASELWRAVPERMPGDERGTLSYLRITTAMEALAVASDDLDELIEVMARDLSSPWRFQRIAEAFQDAGRLDDAIDWVNRGRSAFTERRDLRLTELLAELRAAQGDPAEAARAAYEALCISPSVDGWRRLRRFAELAGTWGDSRARALEHLTAEAADRTEPASDNGYVWRRRAAGDVLARIHLDEDDLEAAWSASQRFGATDPLWLELARRRGADRPDDALEVYRRLIEGAIAGRDRRAYREAARLLDEVRSMLSAHDRANDFEAELSAVRRAHARKPALLDELDKARRGWEDNQSESHRT